MYKTMIRMGLNRMWTAIATHLEFVFMKPWNPPKCIHSCLFKSERLLTTAHYTWANFCWLLSRKTLSRRHVILATELVYNLLLLRYHLCTELVMDKMMKENCRSEKNTHSIGIGNHKKTQSRNLTSGYWDVILGIPVARIEVPSNEKQTNWQLQPAI
jgi:hypothetical protein